MQRTGLAVLICAVWGAACSGQNADRTFESNKDIPSTSVSPTTPAITLPVPSILGGQDPDPTALPAIPGYRPVRNTPTERFVPHEGHDAPATVAPREERRFSFEYWVSPVGDDAAAGTKERPFRTIGRAVRVLRPGEAAHVLAGDYVENVLIRDVAHGTADQPIYLLGEGRPRILPAANWGTVIAVESRHWVLDGFDVNGNGLDLFGIYFAGDVTGSQLRNSEIHGGMGTAGISIHNNATDVLIENNHIHGFRRGEDDAHGVVVQTTSRRTTIRANDIHDVSGDAVHCLGPEGYNDHAPADGVLIEGNHLYSAQENGVDIKTCHNVVIRNNRIHQFRRAAASQGAQGDAVVVHLSAQNVSVEGNDIFDCGRGISLGGNRFGPLPGGVVIQKNRIHDTVTDDGVEGSAVHVENSSRAQIVNNTFTRLAGAGVIVGGGINGPTENLLVANNIIDSSRPLEVGPQAPGLKLQNNLYPNLARFLTTSGTFTFDTWQRAGVEQSPLSAPGALTQQGPELLPAKEGIDRGATVGLPFCGTAPDVGAVETGC